MKKIMKWLEPTKNKVIAGVIGAIVVVSCGFGIYALVNLANPEYSLQIKPNESQDLVIEYGKEVPVDEITSKFKFMENGKEVTNDKVVLASEPINTKTVTYKLTAAQYKSLKSANNGDLYKWHVEQMADAKPTQYKVFAKDGNRVLAEAMINVIVVDTVAPTFQNLKDIEIPLGGTFDSKSLIKATDPIDGNVETKYEGQFDVNVAGTYELKATAVDKNGNKIEQSFKLIVKEADNVAEETNPSGSGSQGSGDSGSNNTTWNNNGDSNGSGSSSGESTPTPPSEEKPAEPETPPYVPPVYQPGDYMGDGLYFYRDYGTHEACNAVMMDVLVENAWNNWSSNYCFSDGVMGYTLN